VVTSLPPERIAAKSLYENVYCARGDLENRIKEQQLCLFADRTSSTALRANEFRLRFSSVGYVLMTALQRLGLQDTEPAARSATSSASSCSRPVLSLEGSGPGFG
jgi:hypothetical protein